MEKINDTLLINIDIGSDNGELSLVEVVTHIGTVRTVLNAFIGDDAELIYKVLVSKHDSSYFKKLKENSKRITLNGMEAVWNQDGKITGVTQIESLSTNTYFDHLPDLEINAEISKSLSDEIDNMASELEEEDGN